MPFYVFTEDAQGRWGYIGQEFFSEVSAQDKADDYDCITHVVHGKTLAEAKRQLRDKMVRKQKDMGLLYKNVRNKETA